MGELSLVASSAVAPGVFHRQHGLFWLPQELQSLLPGINSKQEILNSCCLQLSQTHLEEQWNSVRLVSGAKQSARTVSTINRSEAIRRKPQLKQKRKGRVGSDRGLSQSYFIACDKLLSFVYHSKKDRTAILSLKESGPEIIQFLSQLCTIIGGTGVAVLFTVMYKVGSGRISLCSVHVRTLFGSALVWLSLAVNNLRDTITYIIKNSNRPKLREEEIDKKVKRSANEVLFRAATIMAIAVLGLAYVVECNGSTNSFLILSTLSWLL